MAPFYSRSYRYTLVIILLTFAGQAFAQGPGRGGRKHTATKSAPLRLVGANEKAPAGNHVEISVEGGERKVKANALPEHAVGPFPNNGNPHSITAQNIDVEIPANPKPADRVSTIQDAGGPFGIALNGVLLDPGTAEFWQGDRDSGWNYEALGGAVPLGLDANYAHVQPSGSYH